MSEQAKAYYQRAREHWTAGRKNEALVAYRQAIELDPQFGYPHYDLGLLLEKTGSKNEEALIHYKRFIELCGSDPRLTQQVEQAWARISALQPKPIQKEVPEISQTERPKQSQTEHRFTPGSETVKQLQKPNVKLIVRYTSIAAIALGVFAIILVFGRGVSMTPFILITILGIIGLISTYRMGTVLRSISIMLFIAGALSFVGNLVFDPDNMEFGLLFLLIAAIGVIGYVSTRKKR